MTAYREKEYPDSYFEEEKTPYMENTMLKTMKAWIFRPLMRLAFIALLVPYVALGVIPVTIAILSIMVYEFLFAVPNYRSVLRDKDPIDLFVAPLNWVFKTFCQ